MEEVEICKTLYMPKTKLECSDLECEKCFFNIPTGTACGLHPSKM